MLSTVLGASQVVRGAQQPFLDFFAIAVAIAAVVLWIAAANYRTRRQA